MFKSSTLDLVMIRKLSKYVRFNLKTSVSTLLFIDDGTLPFSSRDSLINGSIICINIIVKFGLTIHTGRRSEKSKIEAVFFSSYKELNKWKLTLNNRLIMNKATHDSDFPNMALSILEAYYNTLKN